MPPKENFRRHNIIWNITNRTVLLDKSQNDCKNAWFFHNIFDCDLKWYLEETTTGESFEQLIIFKCMLVRVSFKEE